MFNCAASHLALAKDSTALRIDHILCHSIHNGLPWHIYSLYLVAMSYWCRQESHCQLESCMKAFTAEREAFLECILF